MLSFYSDASNPVLVFCSRLNLSDHLERVAVTSAYLDGNVPICLGSNGLSRTLIKLSLKL